MTAIDLHGTLVYMDTHSRHANTPNSATSIGDGVKRPRIRQPRHRKLIAVDALTGHLTGMLYVQDKTEPGDKKKQHHFPRGFTFMDLIHISMIARLDLPADAFKLIFFIIEQCGYDGEIRKPHTFFAEFLGVDRPRATRLLQILEENGLIKRDGRCKIVLSPLFCTRGTAESQERAIKQWNALTQPFIVFPAQMQQLATA